LLLSVAADAPSSQRQPAGKQKGHNSAQSEQDFELQNPLISRPFLQRLCSRLSLEHCRHQAQFCSVLFFAVGLSLLPP
jgi:hypothetical protein